MQSPPPPPQGPSAPQPEWTPPPGAAAPPPPPPTASTAPIWQPGQSTGAVLPPAVTPAPTPRRRRRTPLLVAAALVVLGGLGAGAYFVFLKDDDANADGFALRPALEAATDASKDAKFEESNKQRGEGTQVEVSQLGLVDADTKVVDFTVTSSTDGVASPAKPVNVVLNVAEHIAYIRATTIPNGETLAGGKTWIEVDKAVVDGRDVSEQFSNVARNPLDVLAVVAKGKSTEIGTLTIGNEELKHFAVSVPTSDVLTFNPGLQAAVTKAGGTLPDAIVFDLFVTKDNHLRRVETDVDLGKEKLASTLVLDTVTEPVTLTAPDKANSVKLSSVAAGLGGS